MVGSFPNLYKMATHPVVGDFYIQLYIYHLLITLFTSKKINKKRDGAYLFLLLVEIVNNDTNEKIEGEEGAEDDEDDKVDVHVEVDLIRGLLLHLGDHK